MEEKPKQNDTRGQNGSSTQVHLETVDKILSLSTGLRKIKSDLLLESDYVIRRLYQRGERLPAFFIVGETGSGKGTIVTWLYHHLQSKASRKLPYRVVNCAAVRGDLLPSEVFGIEKGIATGVNKRVGKVASARDGFLFLDEIDKAPAEFANALLTWLDRGKYNPVGDDGELKESRVVVVCAMIGDPYRLVEEGKWSSDFVYRFSDPIYVLPLRQNKDDIVPLAMFFAERFLRCYFEDDSLKIEISGELADDLEQCSWPGNIRELETRMENLVKRALRHKTATPIAHLILTRELLNGDLSLPNQITTDPQQKKYLYTPPSSLREYDNITRADFERTVLAELKQRSKGKEKDAIRNRIARLPQGPGS